MFPSRVPPHDHHPSETFEPRLLIPSLEHRHLVRPVSENSSKAKRSTRCDGSRFNPYRMWHHAIGSGVKGNRNPNQVIPTIHLNEASVQANRPNNRAWMMYHAPTPMVYAASASINFRREDVNAVDHFGRVAAMGVEARTLRPLRGFPTYHLLSQNFEEYHRQLRYGVAEYNHMYMIPGVPRGPDRIPDFINIQNGFGAGVSDDEDSIVSVQDDADDFDQETLPSDAIVTNNDDMNDDHISGVSVTETEEIKGM